VWGNIAMAVKSRRRRKKRKLAKKYKRRRAVTAIVIIAIIVSVCFAIDALQRHKEKGLIGKNITATPMNNTPGGSQPLSTPAADNGTKDPTQSAGTGSKTQKPTGTSIPPAIHELDFSATLYFPNEDISYLVKESAILKYKGTASKVSNIDTADKIRISMEALAKDPGNDSTRTFMPKGTKVLDVKVNGKKAVINFSKEFRDNQGSSSLSARMTLGQIVLTCGELGIDEVTIEIGGKPVEDYPGGADLSKPLNKSDYFNLIE
jgi:hypothetical protein